MRCDQQKWGSIRGKRVAVVALAVYEAQFQVGCDFQLGKGAGSRLAGGAQYADEIRSQFDIAVFPQIPHKKWNGSELLPSSIAPTAILTECLPIRVLT